MISIYGVFSSERNALKIFSTGLVLDQRPTLVIVEKKEVNIFLNEKIDLSLFEDRSGRSACSNATKIILGQTFSQYAHGLMTLMRKDSMESFMNVVQDSSPLFAMDEPKPLSPKSYRYESGTWSTLSRTNIITIHLRNGQYNFKQSKSEVLISEERTNPLLLEFNRAILSFELKSNSQLVVIFNSVDETKFLLTSLKPQTGVFTLSKSRKQRSIRSFFDLASLEDLNTFKKLMLTNNNLTSEMTKTELLKISEKVDKLGLVVKRDQALANGLKAHLCDLEAQFERSVSIALLKLQVGLYVDNTFKIIKDCKHFHASPLSELEDFLNHHCEVNFPNVAECNDLSFFQRHSKCSLDKVNFFKDEVIISLKIEVPVGPYADIEAFRLYSLPIFNKTSNRFSTLNVGPSPTLVKLETGHLAYINNCDRGETFDICHTLDVNPSGVECVKSIFWPESEDGKCHAQIMSNTNETCFHLAFSQGFVISSSKEITFEISAPKTKSGFVSPPRKNHNEVHSGLFFIAHTKNMSFTCANSNLKTDETNEHHNINITETHKPDIFFSHIDFKSSSIFTNLENKLSDSILIPKPKFNRIITRPVLYGIYGFLGALGLIAILVLLSITFARLTKPRAISFPY